MTTSVVLTQACGDLRECSGLRVAGVASPCSGSLNQHTDTSSSRTTRSPRASVSLSRSDVFRRKRLGVAVWQCCCTSLLYSSRCDLARFGRPVRHCSRCTHESSSAVAD